MKVKRSRRSEILQSTTSSENTDTGNNEGKKSLRRKSLGPLRGLSLSLRPRGTESSNQSSENNSGSDDKTSLLKRFGLRRSSKKNKSSVCKSDTKCEDRLEPSVEELEQTGSKALRSHAGHTPKSQRLQQLDSTKVQEMLHHSPWDSGDSDCEQDTSRTKTKTNSLKMKGRKLKRSLSVICGGSRSKLIKMDSAAPVSRGRRSLGGDLMTVVNNNRKERLDSSVSSEKEAKPECGTSPVCLDFNIKSTDSDTPRYFDACTPLLGTRRKRSGKRRLSDAGLVLSGKKYKIRRESYNRMNMERDHASPLLQKRSNDSDTNSQTLPKRRRSIKRTWSSLKLASKPENIENSFPKNTAEPPRRSLRRKSLGIAASPAADRRGSGMYASSAHTPTFMTCGYVMTDSPPDRSDYNSESLPWVTMKRKQRSEVADNSRVNSYNAGHTPLPARKKRRSYGERLIE